MEIANSNFFCFKDYHPPENEDLNLVVYGLSVTMDDTTHSTKWTSKPKQIPEKLTELVKQSNGSFTKNYDG